jgi:hypothetical protein
MIFSIIRGIAGLKLTYASVSKFCSTKLIGYRKEEDNLDKEKYDLIQGELLASTF